MLRKNESAAPKGPCDGHRCTLPVEKAILIGRAGKGLPRGASDRVNSGLLLMESFRVFLYAGTNHSFFRHSPNHTEVGSKMGKEGPHSVSRLWCRGGAAGEVGAAWEEKEGAFWLAHSSLRPQ